MITTILPQILGVCIKNSYYSNDAFYANKTEKGTLMLASEIRDKFVKFFEENGHVKVNSSPLVPIDDPTLLFANAGMNQFKDYFTGKAQASDKRAVSIQKCVRAGGKHNDLENVGFTARHHTFFEMLGNFSFGDYFKEDAIKFAWTFLTEVLNIPSEKLYITCHDSDKEAFNIWHKKIGVSKDKIFYKGDKDNFWEMGDTGPCGPCSEIFYDHGEQYNDKEDHAELIDHESRLIEIWNLVFMQFEKYIENDQIKQRPLPNPCVDTGAGLERLSAVLNSVYWNYDTDLFQPIIKKLESLSGKSYEKEPNSMRVIADHIKSSVMLITDGVIPSNEGRGYVLRRIIRRAVRHIDELGIKETTMPNLADTVFEILGNEYKQNKKNISLAKNYLELEEEKFKQTLSKGLELLEGEIKSANKEEAFSGEVAFKLYDTYGFPLDLTETILRERDFTLDTHKFEELMRKQKERSKKSSTFQANEDNLKEFYQLKEKHGETLFLGYEGVKANAKLIGIIDGDKKQLIFNQTPFYGESGGQAGDQGSIKFDGEAIGKIIDTQKAVDGIHVHIFDGDVEKLTIGNEYELEINISRRKFITRNHSATHLLQSALINVLGDHIKQAGSSVLEDRLRFDFTHPKAVSTEELKKVEKLVNEQIQKGLEVHAEIMDMDKAQNEGAMALFGEKYGDRVRVLKMGKFSTELCGGTHVKSTADIGLFVITQETSLASGIRRIEAATSASALTYLSERSKILSQIERSLSTNAQTALEKIETLRGEVKNKNNEIKSLKSELQSFQSENMFDNKTKLNDMTSLVHAKLEDVSSKEFRALSDKFTEKNEKDVLLLTTTEGGKYSYLLRTSKTNKQINCSAILKDAQELIGGRGGGRPDMAQGSAQTTSPEVFEQKVVELIKASL